MVMEPAECGTGASKSPDPAEDPLGHQIDISKGPCGVIGTSSVRAFRVRGRRKTRIAYGVLAVILVATIGLTSTGAVDTASAGGICDTEQGGSALGDLLLSGFTLNFPQKYVSRGLQYDEDRVSQYSAWVSLVRVPVVDYLKAIGFANLSQSGTPNEWDLFIEATEMLKVNAVPVTLTAGYGLYNRGELELGTDMVTQEVYGILAVATIGNPTVAFVRDVDMVRGSYTELSIHHSISHDLFGVGFSAKIAYNDSYYSRGKGLSYKEFGAEISVFADDQVTITPYARVVNPWDTGNDISYHFISGVRIEGTF
jgi:hypothetical protein